MFDEDNYIFVLKNKVIDLTPRENIIIKLLVDNKGDYVSLKTLCFCIYNNVDKGLLQLTRLSISRLRKKINTEYKIINHSLKGYKILTL